MEKISIDKVIRTTLNYLLIGGIVFAALYLMKLDVSISIHEFSIVPAVLSLLILALVFVLRGYIWYRSLMHFGIKVKTGKAITSQLIALPTKYIPGKIWGMVGRADTISKLGYSLGYCSFISVFLQVVYIITGLFVGLFGVLLFDFSFLPPSATLGLLFILLFAHLALMRGFQIPGFMDNRIKAEKARQLLKGRIPPTADIILLSLLNWLMLGYAFSIFVQAIGFDAGLYPLLLQPLANNIGILSFFAPAGIGVREGVMFGYLKLAGISSADAITVAVSTRVWFFAVEMFMFIGGLVNVKTSPGSDVNVSN